MNAKRDDNRVASLLGVSSLDFSTPVTIAANPTTHGLLIDGASLYADLDIRYAQHSGGLSTIYIADRVACLGDSITNSMYAYLQTALGAGWFVGNGGIAGNSTASMLLRYADVISTGTEYVVVMGGVNDIAGSTTDVDVEANLQAIYTGLKAWGKTVIAVTITPWKNHALWTAGKQTYTDNVNTWIMNTATNVDYRIDAYSVLEDPDNLDALLPAYDSTDHLHLSVAGYTALANTIYSGTTWTRAVTTASIYSEGTPLYFNQTLQTTDAVKFKELTVSNNGKIKWVETDYIYPTNNLYIYNAARSGQPIAYFDSTNRRIGVNNSTPSTSLHITGGLFVDGASDEVQLRLQNYSTQTNYLMTFENTSNTVMGGISGTCNLGLGSVPLAGYRITAKGSTSISATTFTGTGLDNMVTAGTYTGNSTAAITFTVVVDATGTPDTFKWKMGVMDYVTGVAMTGGNQALRDGVSIKFNTTTGHTLNDQWTFTVSAMAVFGQQVYTSNSITTAIGAGGNIGIGLAPVDGVVLKVSKTYTEPYYDPLGYYYYGTTLDLIVNPTANTVSGYRAYGLQCNASKGGNYSCNHAVGGRFNTAIYGGSLSNQSGGQFISQQTSVNATTTNLYAGEFQIQKYTAGTTWTVTNAYLMRGSYDTVGGTWAFANAYGLYLTDVNVGTNNAAIRTFAGHIIFNDGGDASTDVRMESDTEANMFWLDADADTDGALYFGGQTNALKVNKGGDTYFIGSGSGLPFGSCYGNEIGWTQASAVQDTWYIISDADIADGHAGFNLTSHDGSGKITVTKPGKYQVVGQVSVESSLLGKHLQVGVAVNGTVVDCTPHQEYGTANSQSTVPVTAQVTVAASGYIELAVRTTDTGTPDISVDHAGFSVIQIGA